MSIAAARANLVATLSDTVYPVHGYGTPKMQTPLIIIDEAQPFLQYGDVLSRPDYMKVNFSVLLFVDTRNQEAAVKAMDEMVQAAVFNLGEWTLTSLESHMRVRLQDNGPEYLVSKLSVTNTLKIGDN